MILSRLTIRRGDIICRSRYRLNLTPSPWIRMYDVLRERRPARPLKCFRTAPLNGTIHGSLEMDLIDGSPVFSTT